MNLPSRRIALQLAAGSSIFLLGSFIALKLENIPVTGEMIISAKQLVGIELTTAQADSLVGSINYYRGTYEALRKLDLPNSVVPALQFNPVPVGFKFPDINSGFKLAKTAKFTLPADSADLAFYSITQLAELLRTKQLTSLELTKFYIRRLKKYKDKLRFVVNLTEEHALRQASMIIAYQVQSVGLLPL